MSDTFGQLIFRPLGRESEIEELLRLICKKSDINICKYGSNEPLNEQFDCNHLEEMAARFWFLKNTYWAGGNRTAGVFRHQTGQGIQSSVLTVWTEHERAQSISALFMEIVKLFGAIYGYVHRVTRGEVAFGRESGALVGNGGGFQMAITRAKLLRCIPDCYWMNIFGPPYVAMFGGDERLREVPGSTIEMLGPSTYALRLAADVDSVEKDYGNFVATRERVKAHLGRECFFSPAKGGTYRVPELGWGERPYAPFDLTLPSS